jgi:hypothetical protein
MTVDQVLWSREQGFWAARSPRIEDRRIEHQGAMAVLTYRVIEKARALRCRSTYALSCGAWLLLEHCQSAA